MAQTVPPADIATQPGTKIVFNAPYNDKHTYHIKTINSSARRIGWAIKTTNMKRLGVDPASGVLDPRKPSSWPSPATPSPSDRRTLTTTASRSSGPTQFRSEWFQGDGMVRRKNLPIEYNP